MNEKTRELIRNYVVENIDTFHLERIKRLRNLKLNNVLKNKNPYLFRCKNLNLAADLMTAVLDARLSSSEEGSFGSFLEHLAIYVSERTGGGFKSAAEGIDIELVRGKTRYLVAVKSGKNWGNSTQYATLKRNFRRAIQLIHQARPREQVQPTLGICYGNFKTKHIGGQSFWHLISGDRNLYIDLIEPLGYRAEDHDAILGRRRTIPTTV